MHYDLSVIVPSLRVHLLQDLLDSIQTSVAPYTFELIVVGPFYPPKDTEVISNIKFIKDYGCPSRCVQMGSTLVEGKLLTWTSDDCIYEPGKLAECIEYLYKKDMRDGLVVRYSEGGNFPDDNYWKSWTHRDQQLPGISKDYFCCPVGMFYRQFYNTIGGLDCRFEHVNMNGHDLAIRLQKNGGKMYLSPSFVMHATFENHLDFHRPLDRAHQQNDAPLFAQIYSQECPDRIYIPSTTWMDAETVWTKRGRFTVN
jgi:hypothetical protein